MGFGKHGGFDAPTWRVMYLYLCIYIFHLRILYLYAAVARESISGGATDARVPPLRANPFQGVPLMPGYPRFSANHGFPSTEQVS